MFRTFSVAIQSMKYRSFFLGCSIFVIALLLRTAFLHVAPVGITDDELKYVLNAKALMLTGKDIAGTWSPFSLQPMTGAFSELELPYLLVAPIIGLFPFSLFWSKLPYAAISSGVAVLVYLIALKLLGKRQAFIIGLVTAFNPWGVFFGRTAYEAPVAIFYYLLGFYLLLIFKNKNILFALIPFYLGFHSYMGTKLILLPLVAILVFFVWSELNKKKYTKIYLLFLAACVGIFLLYLTSIPKSFSSTRLSELSTPNTYEIAQLVDYERKLSITTPLTPLFSNKATVWGKELLNKYFSVFSLELLFSKGEGRSTFSLWTHGYFYYIDIIFLAVGLISLMLNKKRVFMLLFSIILISPIPTLASVSGTGFAALRSALLFPILCICIGVGIDTLFTLTTKKWLKILTIIICILYAIHFIHFINIYFFRYPIYSSEAYSFSYRLISRYIELAKQRNTHVMVIAGGSKTFFYHFLFDANLYTRHHASNIQTIINSPQPYTISNASFTDCSPNILVSKQDSVIMTSNADCYQITESLHTANITLLADGGHVFSILNDVVCKDYELKTYPYNIQFSDFDVAHLSEKQFCETFITK